MLFVLAGLFRIAYDPVSDWWWKQRLEAVSGRLNEPRTVAGVELPAGTKVHWSLTDKSDFDVADLPGTTSILALKVKGKVYYDRSRFCDDTGRAAGDRGVGLGGRRGAGW